MGKQKSKLCESLCQRVVDGWMDKRTVLVLRTSTAYHSASLRAASLGSLRRSTGLLDMHLSTCVGWREGPGQRRHQKQYNAFTLYLGLDFQTVPGRTMHQIRLTLRSGGDLNRAAGHSGEPLFVMSCRSMPRVPRVILIFQARLVSENPMT